MRGDMSNPSMRKVKIALDFSHLRDVNLLTTCYAVDTGVFGNVKFANPVIDAIIFRTQVSAFSTALTAALDGGRTAAAEKNKQRELTVKMLVKLARYVEAVSENDVATRTS